MVVIERRSDRTAHRVQLLEPVVWVWVWVWLCPLRSQFLVLHGVEPLEELFEVGPDGERAFQCTVAWEIGFEAAASLGCVKHGAVCVKKGNDGKFMWVRAPLYPH